MQIFYAKMWREKNTPLEALRQAQLTIYHHPELIAELGADRGRIDFSKTALLQPPQSSAQKADPSVWAAFVLSGLGY